MTKSPRKNVLDVGMELGAACIPSGHASDRATAPGDRKIIIIIMPLFHEEHTDSIYANLP